MIGQYLSQTKESATVPVLQNFLELIKIYKTEHNDVIPQSLRPFSLLDLDNLNIHNISYIRQCYSTP
jgi:hypothetical protein